MQVASLKDEGTSVVRPAVVQRNLAEGPYLEEGGGRAARQRERTVRQHTSLIRFTASLTEGALEVESV